MSLAMNQQFVRDEVAEFHKRGAYGRAEEDCFPAWYLHHRYGLAANDAVAQTAEGADGVRKNYDFGLDAFHLLSGQNDELSLLLIQAKYSDSLAAVSTALRDLGKVLPRVAEALQGSPSMALKENRVLVNLRDRLRHLDEAQRAGLRLRFVVLHLCDADDLKVRANTRKAYDDLKQQIADDEVLEGRLPGIDIVGPRQMGGAIPDDVKPSQLWHDVALASVAHTAALGDREVTMYSGIGRLADLVDIYNQRRGDLFAKNVRYFLTGKQNEERGPSGKIKETLSQMCIPRKGAPSEAPELFAFHHNGITIFAREVERNADGGITRIRDPFVLNGCQTVRSAYDFRYDARRSGRIDEERWRRVALPIRIMTTQKEELIRQITISNNRQNQIAPSALRANDEIQIDLERRLHKREIFYERQKGAFDELLRSNSARLDEYKHTNNRAVRIDDLARCLAAAAGQFDLAHSPSHIFEHDSTYDAVFAPEHLPSPTFVVLLQNLHDVLPVILKNDLGLESPTDAKAPRKSRLVYYAMCLLLRHLAKNRMDDWVAEHGSELLGKETQFREAVVLQMSNYKAKIKQGLKDNFLTLPDTTADSMREAFRKTAWALSLRDTIDVFGILGTVDERIGDD